MPKNTKILGNQGEEQAAKHLKKSGYHILERNYFVRGGELDIIAQKGGYIVFVEVKTRKNAAFGTPAESVTYTKMQRMQKAAQQYLMFKPETDVRFDVIEVYGEMAGDRFVFHGLNHIENAF